MDHSKICLSSALVLIRSRFQKSTIETLIKAGAFDFSGANRQQMFLGIEKSGSRLVQPEHADRKAGQKNLFAAVEDDEDEQGVTHAMPDMEDWPERQKANFEKEVLGFYLSSHPLAEFDDQLNMFCSHDTAAASELKHKTEAILGGMISSIKLSNTRKTTRSKWTNSLCNVGLRGQRRNDAMYHVAKSVCGIWSFG